MINGLHITPLKITLQYTTVINQNYIIYINGSAKPLNHYSVLSIDFEQTKTELTTNQRHNMGTWKN